MLLLFRFVCFYQLWLFPDSSSSLGVEANNKPKLPQQQPNRKANLFLHIGPKKAATTTIQCAIQKYFDNQKKEIDDDVDEENYMVLVSAPYRPGRQIDVRSATAKQLESIGLMSQHK